MHQRKCQSRQQLLVVFLFGLVAGSLAGNYLTAGGITDQGALTRYYIKQLQYVTPDIHALLWQVGCSRMIVFASVCLFAVLLRGRYVHSCFAAWSGFSYGYFCVLLIRCFAVKGLLIGAAALFPQFLIYVPLWLVLVEWSSHYRLRDYGRNFAVGGLLVIGLVVGILLESYINPPLLQKILKIL